MRKILFKGIWVHGNKEWIEGDLVRDSEGKPHIVDTKYAVYWKGEPIFVCEEECEVIPETVGQYTGLTDKNGKKIFEGDIVRCYGLMRTVEYDSKFAHFEFGKHDNVENPDGLALCCDHDASEVIGNIHDNPELLEVN